MIKRSLTYLLTSFALVLPSHAEVDAITKSVSGEDKQKIVDAAPAKAPAEPKKDRKMLVFSLTKGFRHGSIPHGVVAMNELGKKTGAFSIEHSEDPAVFTKENLARFDAVMMLNTTGELFEEVEKKAALSEFVKSGKGLVGIHSATDTFYSWPEYGEMMGGYFDGHPWHEEVTLKVEDPDHATCACFEHNKFVIKDEIYQYKEKPYSRDRLRVLLSLDPDGTNMSKGGMKRQDGDYAVGWVNKHGDGNIFYCNLGHRNETFCHPTVLQHFLAGIQFAFGDLAGDTTPSNQLEKEKKQASSKPAGPLKKGDRLAIVGDSITEQKLYSKYIETYLLACMPQLNVQCLQFGWGGERAPGFAARLANDMAPWKPTIMTTCYGMNDGSYRAYEEGIGKRYADGMQDIVEQAKALGTTVVVGSPGIVDSDTFAKDRPDFDKIYNANLEQLSKIAEVVAKDNGFTFANVFEPMMKAMVAGKEAHGSEYHVGGGDGVHPAPNGHLSMAHAFLKGLGMKGNLGMVRVNFKNGKAKAANGHEVLSSQDGVVTVKSSRYPFCFTGEKDDPNGTRSILPFLPFNKQLNRFRLVVKNLPEAHADVTWGGSTKTFTREQLDKGVNLANAFVDSNPFAVKFAAVMEAVEKKQRFETPMIKSQINGFRRFTETFNGDAEVEEALKVLRDKLFAKNDELYHKAKATVTPLEHVIKIVPKA
jgi:type 1 glutamine amidotransferase/lysophospholipase L1-like esterase